MDRRSKDAAIAAGGDNVAAPKYARGQHVTLIDRRDVGAAWNGGYRITALAAASPHRATPRYRILSTGGAHSRWADEAQLTPACFIERR